MHQLRHLPSCAPWRELGPGKEARSMLFQIELPSQQLLDGMERIHELAQLDDPAMPEAQKMRNHGGDRTAGPAMNETRKDDHGRVVAFAYRKDRLIADEFELRIAGFEYRGHG